MALSPDIRELVRQGVAVVVATRAQDLRPAITRAWGPQLADDGRRLTLCVEAPEGSATHANLTAGAAFAATLSRPSTYSTVQLKGPLLDCHAPVATDLERVAAHLDAFVLDAATVGLDPVIGRRMAGPGLLTVVMEVIERYDQTPGPGAGASL